MLTSWQNQQIQHLKKLLTCKKYRQQKQQYVLETNKPEKIAELSDIERIYTCVTAMQGEKVVLISENLCKKLATTENLIKYFVVLKMNLVNKLPAGNLILADNIQDPGNLGTIIRTAVAFGYQALIITDGTTDPFAPKVVRSSSGTVSRLKILKFDQQLIEGKLLIAADLQGTDSQGIKKSKEHILILGNEGNGLSSSICQQNILRVTIPTAIESLNVSIAAGILMYQLSRSS